MALDEALMRRARATGEWVARVYSWSPPTLSLGRNQRARGGYSLDAMRSRGIGVVRRPTGGRAILHDREITYSVTGRAGAGDALGESYTRINRLLLVALRALGAAAQIVDREHSLSMTPDHTPIVPGLLPCFHHPAEGEIVLGGAKLAGSAQWRHDGAFLQHGSILVDDDQSQLGELARSAANDGDARPRPAVATLRDALGRAPSPRDFADALFDAVRAHEDPCATTLALDDDTRRAVRTLRASYLDDAWTWRR